MTTVRDLIEMLSDLPEDAEVRLAHQPSWPFEYSIANVALVDLGEPDPDDAESAMRVIADPECTPEEKDEARAILEPDPEGGKIVYIAEGSQLGYLPGVARAHCWP